MHFRPFVLAAASLLCFSSIPVRPAHAQSEIKVIEAEASFSMGDNDSKVDARRIAVQESQRKALEMAGTYVASLSRVRDLRLTGDEVTAYTAGVMETETLQEEMRGTAERPLLHIKTRSRIDTDVLLRQIEHFQDNEDLREQLLASQKENEALKKERDGLVARIEAEKDKDKLGSLRKKLDTVLLKEETGAEVSRLWTLYAKRTDLCDPTHLAGGLDPVEAARVTATLERAVATSPRNVRARLLLAAVQELNGAPDDAQRTLRAAIAAHPTNPLFRMRLGLLLNRRDRHEEALKQFLAVERLRPRNSIVFFYIGMTYKDMDQCRQSVVNLKRFLVAAERKRSQRLVSMKQSAAETVKECESRPRGPAGRQKPIRKLN